MVVAGGGILASHCQPKGSLLGVVPSLGSCFLGRDTLTLLCCGGFRFSSCPLLQIPASRSAACLELVGFVLRCPFDDQNAESFGLIVVVWI